MMGEKPSCGSRRAGRLELCAEAAGLKKKASARESFGRVADSLGMNPFPRFTAATAASDVQAVLRTTERQFGFLPDALAAMAGSPQLVEAFQAANAAFHRATFTALEREVISVALGVELDCDVCVALHGKLLGRLGPRHVAPLKERRPLDDARLETLRATTLRVLERRGALDDAELAAFFAAGFTQRQALELALACGTLTLSIFANRMTGAVVDAGLQS